MSQVRVTVGSSPPDCAVTVTVTVAGPGMPVGPARQSPPARHVPGRARAVRVRATVAARGDSVGWTRTVTVSVSRRRPCQAARPGGARLDSDGPVCRRLRESIIAGFQAAQARYSVRAGICAMACLFRCAWHPLNQALIVLYLRSNTVDAAKLRSWLGPDYFLEGNSPSAREGHGFTGTKDNKTYVFGGNGPSGNLLTAAAF